MLAFEQCHTEGNTGQELRLMKTLKRRKQYIVFLY